MKNYIPAIQKLAFHLSHVRILGTHHCGKELREAFKRQGNLHDVLCYSGYEEQVVSIFSHKIKSEYYDGNRSVYIDGIALEHFSA